MKENKHRTYTEEEIDQMKAWFDAQTLPPTLQLDKATTIPDLGETLISLFEQAYICRENPKMLGCIRLLEKIREILEGESGTTVS